MMDEELPSEEESSNSRGNLVNGDDNGSLGEILMDMEEAVKCSLDKVCSGGGRLLVEFPLREWNCARRRT